MTKILEFKNKDQTELKSNLEILLQEQFKLRLLKNSGELKDVSKVKKIQYLLVFL